MFEGLSRLRDAGFTPGAIIDAGAYEGWFARMARQIWPSAHILMIEAMREKFDGLAALSSEIDNAHVEIALLGDSEGTSVDFHVVMGGDKNQLITSGSSKYAELTGFEQQTRKIDQTTLDSLVKNYPHVFDFVKMDVQGAELDVLKGFAQNIQFVQFFLLECSIVRYNRGAPLFEGVVSTFKEMGLCLFDIIDTHRINGELFQIDAIFCRKDSRFRLNFGG